MRARPLLEPAAKALRDAIGARGAATTDARAHGGRERPACGQRLEQLELLRLLVASHHLEAAAEDDRKRRARPRQIGRASCRERGWRAVGGGTAAESSAR